MELPASVIESTIRKMRGLVAQLESPNVGHWEGYESTLPYEAAEIESKRAFVSRAVDRASDRRLALDIGANEGLFTAILADGFDSVVAIDNASYLELQIDPLAPWPRALPGALVRTLKAEGARSVAFDVLFEGPRDPAQDVHFELGLFDAGNVVLGSTVERVDDPRFRQASLIDPYPPFAEVAAAVAEVELPPDTDGTIRETCTSHIRI